MKVNNNLRKWLISVAVVVVALFLVFSTSKNFYTVAVVNGTPVYRYSLIKELEKQYGKQLLDQKITEQLILQKAKEQAVEITAEEIDEEIGGIEQNLSAQGQDFEALLEAQGMNRDVLKQQIRMQKLVEKLAPQPEDPSEEEVNAQLEKQKETFPKEMDEAEKRTQVINQLKQQQRNQSIQEWIKSLRDSARIEYLRTY
jgi:parvulin-like peptidyl-prolyl isomerase